MSPEQVRGEPTDARTDIFAFGTVFYEMLSGRRAFGAETAVETMTGILRSDPPELPPGEVPPVLDRIVRRCLQKSQAQRFQSAVDLAFALVQAADPAAPCTVGALPSERVMHLIHQPQGKRLEPFLAGCLRQTKKVADGESVRPEVPLRRALRCQPGTFCEPHHQSNGFLDTRIRHFFLLLTARDRWGERQHRHDEPSTAARSTPL